MRSSFNRATIIKQVALGMIVASSLGFDLAANAEPYSGQMRVLKHERQYLIAQGDASLPPPDPNYRPKNRFQPDAIGAGAGVGASDQAEDGPIRRRLRRRMNAGNGGVGNGNFGNGGNGLGAQQSGGSLGAATILGAPVGGGGRFKNGFGGGGGGGAAGLFGRKALDLTTLNLTPDQKQKIQEMRGQLAPKTRELRKQLNAKRMELRDMMFEANAGDDQVRAKRKEVRQLQDKVEDLQINDFLGIRSVLTPDQRQKLTDLKPGNKVAGTQMIAPVISSP